jgi:HNH endonuclease
MVPAVVERLVEPEPTSGCWLWTGATTRGGYGTFRRTVAHRWMYQATVGAIPEGHDLHHRCHTTLCVNPGHLEPLSQDAHHGGPQKTHCVRGHARTPENLAGTNCRICLKAHRRRYYEANREARLDKQRAYYARNQDARVAYAKAWRAKQKEMTDGG